MPRIRATRSSSDRLLVLAIILAIMAALMSGRPQQRQMISGLLDSVRISMAGAAAAAAGG